MEENKAGLDLVRTCERIAVPEVRVEQSASTKAWVALCQEEVGGRWPLSHTYLKASHTSLSRAKNGTKTYAVTQMVDGVYVANSTWRSMEGHRRYFRVEAGAVVEVFDDQEEALEWMRAQRGEDTSRDLLERVRLVLGSGKPPYPRDIAAMRDCLVQSQKYRSVHVLVSQALTDERPDVALDLFRDLAPEERPPSGLPPLKGSEKQVEWATKIRSLAFWHLDWGVRKYVGRGDFLDMDEYEEAFVDELRRRMIGQKSASFWIKYRGILDLRGCDEPKHFALEWMGCLAKDFPRSWRRGRRSTFEWIEALEPKCAVED